MKKLLIILLLLVFSLAAYGQNFFDNVGDWRAEGMIGTSRLTGETDNYTNLKSGFIFSLGANGSYFLHENVDVRAGLRYTRAVTIEEWTYDYEWDDTYGIDYNYNDKIKLKFAYIGVPIHIVAKPGWRIADRDISLGFGIEPVLNVSSKVKFENDWYEMNDSVHNFNLFLEGLVMYDICERGAVGLDLRYGVVDTFKNTNDVSHHLLIWTFRTSFKF